MSSRRNIPSAPARSLLGVLWWVIVRAKYLKKQTCSFLLADAVLVDNPLTVVDPSHARLTVIHIHSFCPQITRYVSRALYSRFVSHSLVLLTKQSFTSCQFT